MQTLGFNESTTSREFQRVSSYQLLHVRDTANFPDGAFQIPAGISEIDLWTGEDIPMQTAPPKSPQSMRDDNYEMFSYILKTCRARLGDNTFIRNLVVLKNGQWIDVATESIGDDSEGDSERDCVPRHVVKEMLPNINVGGFEFFGYFVQHMLGKVETSVS